MPRVGTVDGIALYIYAGDHPPPHFHAIAAERNAVIGIADFSVIVSTLTGPQQRTVIAWARANQTHLWAEWYRFNP